MTRMRPALLTPLLLCAALSLSRAAEGPAHAFCPDRREPVLTGHPFRPLLCPEGGKEAERAKVELSSSTLPDPSDSERARLGDLNGTWRGLAYYGGQRYEVTFEVKGSKARWTAMDYRTHVQFPLDGRLKKPGWFSRGEPKVFLKAEGLPGQELSGRLWLGAAPLVDATNPPLDRLAAWSFSQRPEAHRVYYAIKGDTLRARYVYSDPERGDLAAEFELTRQR
jgi:hypothetical protein